MSGARIAYQPALDGVRALAVVAVLLFHAGTPGFDGGYLGVSVFFTLSGYLITSLLVQEHDSTGRIDLAAFYGRRLRRLLPASLATVAVIAVIAATTDLFERVDGLRTHVFGAVFQVANWVFLSGEGSYQDLLAQASGAVSPLEHFWSLAIEEQFYWFWPFTVMVAFGRLRTRRSRLTALSALTVTAMVAAPVIAQTWGPDAAYWATPARLSEILIGAWIALALSGRSAPDNTGVLAPVALAALAACVVLFPASSGPAYEGALPLIAVASGALLIGLQSDSPVRRALSTSPLVWLGKISYGVYLFHWPIYVLVDADRTGWPTFPLTVVRLGLTLAVAVISYQLLEQPIRRTRRSAFTPTIGLAAAATVTVAIAGAVLVPSSLGNYWEVDDAVAASAAIEVVDQPLTALAAAASTTSPPTTTPPSTMPPPATSVAEETPAVSSPAVSTAPAVVTTLPEPEPAVLPPLPELARPVRVVVTGDSTAQALGTGVVNWAAANPDLAQAEVQSALGCGFLTGGERLNRDVIETMEICDGWVDRLLIPVVERTQPDVVVVMTTTWDVLDHRWDGDTMLSPLDPEFRMRLETTYSDLVDALIGAGAARVAFVREPIPDVWWQPEVIDQEQPERHQLMYDMYADFAADHPDIVTVIGLAEWFTEAGLDDDQDVRPDGIHLTPESATSVTDEYLGDQIVRAALGMETR